MTTSIPATLFTDALCVTIRTVSGNRVGGYAHFCANLPQQGAHIGIVGISQNAVRAQHIARSSS